MKEKDIKQAGGNNPEKQNLHEIVIESIKRGRPPKFKTPIDLWNACQDYFRWCDANPLLETDFRGKDATEVSLPHPRPYTLTGLCAWLGVSERFWRDLRGSKKEDDEFSPVITRVEQIIYTNKFEGAAVGFFNANIIARDLGLADKRDISAQVNDLRKSVDELFPPTSEIIGEEEEEGK